ncbi:TPA: hypothetical protein G8M64_004631 [Salmonella enterica]|nr:hypothetical protein [Salmonella enterica subsp. enterica]ECF3546099.1 hypothetical protein [Salmonella enterica subsp. enterica]ECJ5182156.1 hypothetical protein [Salmonella enterica subsp. enterica]MKA12548.1 hypothetical protein [Salmonella enterica subsp. enterica]HAF1610277.1 hypothetical protein [Salmonella enterica]
MANQKAIWAITLHTECPKCREYFDIIHHNDDFWVDANFDTCEQDTPATTDVEVVCPECGHEFECDFAY